MRAASLALILPLLAACASSGLDLTKTQESQLAHTYVQLANGYMQRGQLAIAKENLDKALELRPDDADANNVMAVLQWRLREYSDAERYFRRALREDDKNAEAQNNYGAFLCERGRVEEALRLFERALANPLYRTPEAANENAGLCLVRAGQHERAEAYFRAALASDPRRPVSLLHLARISFDSERLLSARAFIERYFDAAADTPQALLLGVRIERALNNKDQEASYAVRLRGKFPASPEAEQLRAAGGGQG